MTEFVEADLPHLQVAVNVPEAREDRELEEITVEMSLDDEIVLVLAWPNDGTPVDRESVAQLFLIAGQAVPQILDQMEAQGE